MSEAVIAKGANLDKNFSLIYIFTNNIRSKDLGVPYYQGLVFMDVVNGRFQDILYAQTKLTTFNNTLTKPTHDVLRILDPAVAKLHASAS